MGDIVHCLVAKDSFHSRGKFVKHKKSSEYFKVDDPGNGQAGHDHDYPAHGYDHVGVAEYPDEHQQESRNHKILLHVALLVSKMVNLVRLELTTFSFGRRRANPLRHRFTLEATSGLEPESLR